MYRSPYEQQQSPLTLMRDTGKNPANQTQKRLLLMRLEARPPFVLAWSMNRIQQRYGMMMGQSRGTELW